MQNEQLKILILGSGGREHMLAKVCAASPLAKEVIVAPGQWWNVEGVRGFSNRRRGQRFHRTIGDGRKCRLRGSGSRGSSVQWGCGCLERKGDYCLWAQCKAGAELEGSKAFTKDFLARHNIPTAAYGAFSEVEDARDFLGGSKLPLVVKASGLAAGKGVVICETIEEAERNVREMLSGESFGESGKESGHRGISRGRGNLPASHLLGR